MPRLPTPAPWADVSTAATKEPARAPDPARHDKVDKAASGIANPDDFTAKTAPRTAKGLPIGLLQPVLRLNRRLTSSVCSGALRPLLVRPSNRVIDAGDFQLRLALSDDVRQDLVPNAPHRTTTETQIGVAPVTEFGGDRTPFSAVVEPPNDRLDRATCWTSNPATYVVDRLIRWDGPRQ
jgi:hypothetical protein